MSTKYLGSRFDIHGGGLDLRFPHHENELAQSAAAGDGFANFWLHNGMVTYEGEKMSKSVGNTISPEQMLDAARPKAVRYFLGQAHYRSQLDYRPTSLREAQAAVERIETFLDRGADVVAEAQLQREETAAVAGALSGEVAPEAVYVAQFSSVPTAFRAAMEDDLNVPQALAVLHDAVRAGNSALAAEDIEAVEQHYADVQAMVDVLGFDDVPEPDAAQDPAAQHALDILVRAQLDARAEAREARDWTTADRIRDTLAAAGVVVEDSAGGARWSLQ